MVEWSWWYLVGYFFAPRTLLAALAIIAWGCNIWTIALLILSILSDFGK